MKTDTWRSPFLHFSCPSPGRDGPLRPPHKPHPTRSSRRSSHAAPTPPGSTASPPPPRPFSSVEEQASQSVPGLLVALCPRLVTHAITAQTPAVSLQTDCLLTESLEDFILPAALHAAPRHRADRRPAVTFGFHRGDLQAARPRDPRVPSTACSWTPFPHRPDSMRGVGQRGNASD